MDLKNYRPVMTTHYTLDWLNAFKLKDIHDLQRSEGDGSVTLLQTAAYVNRSMSQIMHGNSAVWGIKENKTGNFVGTFSLRNIDLQGRSTKIEVNFLETDAKKTILNEIVVHIFQMLQTDLKFNSIYIDSNAVADFEEALSELEFERVEYTGEPNIAKFMQAVK